MKRTASTSEFKTTSSPTLSHVDPSKPLTSSPKISFLNNPNVFVSQVHASLFQNVPSSSIRPLRILMADDNAVNVMVAKLILLKTFNCEVITAKSAEQGEFEFTKALAEQKGFDLIITDHYMLDPKDSRQPKNGDVMIGGIRQVERKNNIDTQTPVIVYSSIVDSKDGQFEELKLKYHDEQIIYLGKTLRSDELIKACESFNSKGKLRAYELKSRSVPADKHLKIDATLQPSVRLLRMQG